MFPNPANRLSNLNFAPIAVFCTLCVILINACTASLNGSSVQPDAVKTVTTLSSSPSVAELFVHSGLPEAPVPIGGVPGESDNRAFAAALKQFAVHSSPDDISALAAYLEAYPQSPWRISVLTNLGLMHYNSARFSSALAAFNTAWNEGKRIDATGPGKAVVDRALGELVRMHARLGHKDDLRLLFLEIEGRPLTGASTEYIAGAKEGLWMMDNEPDVAYLCGPKALESIIDHTHPQGAKREDVEAARSGPQGYSLDQVEALAKQSNLSYRMVKREPGAHLVMPSVVHWKSNHYAALLEQQGDRLHIKDPTFGGDLWVSRKSLEQEASGYMLIPEGKLTQGYAPVTLVEAGKIYGRGYTGSSDNNATTPDDDKAKPPCSTPMCQYNFHTLLVSLNIEDTPVGYTPPVGPSVRFTVTYNQREANQPANFTYANLGTKWTFNWLTYLEDDPSFAARDIKRYVAGGGAEMHTGYSAASQSYAPQVASRAVLVRTSTVPVRYELRWPDGSVDIFAQPDGGSVYPRKVFLTEKRDAQGNTVTLNYDSSLRIVQITDALGQNTAIAYENGVDPYKITKVTDPFGRSAAFVYNNAGQLTSITDVIGIQSQLAYGTNQFINGLTTPYGTTAFAYGENGTSRWLEATDSQGDKERLEYLHGAPGIPFSESVVPQGLTPVFNAYINGRNSFYWDKHAMKMAPGDYTKARLTHWLHGVNTSVSVAVKESEKQPLENRVWYSYPGQTWGGGTVSSMIEKPKQVARVLDDGSTQLYQYSYNTLGKVTKAIDPLGRETVYEYSSDGIDLLRIKQKNGTGYDLLAELTYNAQHRPVTYQDASGAITTINWNSAGQLLSATNALNETTRYEYDAQGYLLREVNPLGRTQVSYTYDNMGRIATATDDSAYTLSYNYDAIDRVTQITYPDGTHRTLGYDKLDLVSDSDRLGHTSQYLYNGQRQLVQSTDALNQITRYSWCGCGSLASLTDPLGQTTTFSHDVQGRLIGKRYADGQGLDYFYEATTSRLKTKIDGLLQESHYSYAKDDALLRIDYANAQNPTPARNFQYDSAYPRLIAFDNGQGQSTLSYHSVGTSGAGRLAREVGPDAFAVAYGYDALTRPFSTTLVKPDASQTVNTISYDALGRIIRNDSDLGPFQYLYEADSTRLQQADYPNNTQSQATYFDALGDFRIKTFNHLDSRGNLLVGNVYSYDATGQIVSWQRSGLETAQQSFAYDAIGQLLKVTDGSSSGRRGAIPAIPAVPGGRSPAATPAVPAIPPTPRHGDNSATAFAYAYDAGGNRSLETIASRSTNAAYNNVNQLLSNGSDSYSYDLEGNQSERQSSTLGNRRYLWDAENRLIALEDPANPATRSEFGYDALGRRIGLQDQSNGVLTQDLRLVYCGTTLCGKQDNLTGNATRYYGDGESRDGTGFYYHRDHLGSVRAVTDAAGSLKADYSYDPYGRRTVLSGSAADSDFGYTGHFMHQASGLALASYRAYDADIGRWISRDPIGERGGVNLYTYVRNNPVNLIDPDGLNPIIKGGIQCLKNPRACAATLKKAWDGCKWVWKKVRDDDVFNSDAPDQTTPGTKTLEGQHINDKGRVEPWEAHYDEYGRQIGRTDYNAGNKAQDIPDTHYHTREYNAQFPNGRSTGDHLPGEYVP